MMQLGHPLMLMQRRFLIRPKRTAHKKSLTGFFKVNSGGSLAGTLPFHGKYALKALEGGRLEDKQLDNARTAIRRINLAASLISCVYSDEWWYSIGAIKPEKGSKVFLRTFPDRPVT
ncbi:MAG: hypothetical protein SGCHY_004490, partial [Lobulomycetales sp.]